MVFFVSRPLSFRFPSIRFHPRRTWRKLFTEDKTTASWQGSEKIENQKGDIFAPQHHSILTLILSVIQRKTHALRPDDFYDPTLNRDSVTPWGHGQETSQVVPWKRWRIRYHWKQQKKTLFFFHRCFGVFVLEEKGRCFWQDFFMLDGSKMMMFGIQLQYTYVFKLVWVWWYILYIQSYKGVFFECLS